jgi:hypothetical protein
MGTEILAFYTIFKSTTAFYPEPYSHSTLLKEFGNVDFQYLPQIGIQKINPQIDAFCSRYLRFIRSTHGAELWHDLFTLNDLDQCFIDPK